MKRHATWMMASAGVLVLLLLTAGGCRKKEPSRGGEGDAINLSALNEIENYMDILRKDPRNNFV